MLAYYINMAIPTLFILLGVFFVFYNSHWTLNFGFTSSFIIPMGIVLIGLILAMKSHSHSDFN